MFSSPAQKNLLPFLRDTLPALRNALQKGEQVIEGIGTANEYAQENKDGSLNFDEDEATANGNIQQNSNALSTEVGYF